MINKWILFLIPVSLIFITESASGQSSQISNAVAGTERTQLNTNRFLPDFSFTPVPTDSAFTNLEIGWQKTPGQMPIYVFGLPPNSMPILTMPLIDEKMIIPGGHGDADSLKTSNPDD